VIKFQNLTKLYPPKCVALDNVSFEIKPKEFVCVVGRSGAGKTTLLKMLIATEKPTSGKIFFAEKDVSLIKSGELPLLRREIGVVFQDYRLLQNKTVAENVSYVMEIMGKTESEIRKSLPNILEIVGLEEKMNNFPLQLSGGEQQRVAIARAIAHRPRVILADEPTGNLDPYNTKEIVRLLKKIHELGTTVVLATHDKEVVNCLQERVVTLEEGKVIRDEEKGRFII
jgi:cell division transport system ATP-binding protein